MGKNSSPEGQSHNEPIAKTRVVISLEGEAAARLLMWADSQGMNRNLAAKKLLIEGMIQKGLLLKSLHR